MCRRNPSAADLVDEPLQVIEIALHAFRTTKGDDPAHPRLGRHLRSHDRPNSGRRCAAGAAKGREIVRPDEHPRRGLHGLDVEWFRYVPHVPMLERTDDRAVPQLVAIGFRARAESRVKRGLSITHVNHADIRRQDRVQSPSKDLGRMRARELGARDLTECVDAGIRSSRAVHGDRCTVEASQRLLEQPLHGYPFRLSLPADQARAVVGDRELQCPRVHTREPGLTTGCPARHRGHEAGS